MIGRKESNQQKQQYGTYIEPGCTPYITERLLIGRKESNQQKQQYGTYIEPGCTPHMCRDPYICWEGEPARD